MPEVLSPAGGWPQLRAAVENGADAVYFGVTLFNARARASNFDAVDDLPEVMKYLHEHGVRGYVALNILIFDAELPAFESQLRLIAAAGVDAVIVQVIPLPLVHAGGPCRTSSSASVRLTDYSPVDSPPKPQGVERVVLGRELSIKEIGQVRRDFGKEVEVFVHGALCVSYSGQCLSSEAWGGRSANRGQCAQACRLPYGLKVGGELREMGDEKYLLSPQDLMAVERVSELIEAGVSCFKIEGRLKGPEYVAVTTKVYREAIDRAWAEIAAAGGDVTAASRSVLTPGDREDLTQVFARGQDANFDGLSKGFLDGPLHQNLVRGRSPRHRGVFLGEVTRVDKAGGVWGMQVNLRARVKRGDGVAFDAGMPEEQEEGGLVYEVKVKRIAFNKPQVVLTFGKGAVELRRLRVGDKVWRTKDMAVDKRLEALAQHGKGGTDNAVGVRASVLGKEGGKLKVVLTDARGRQGVAETSQILEPALKGGLDETSVGKAIGQLGGTGMRAVGALHISPREIKEARRQAVDALLTARVKHSPTRTQVGVLCRTRPQAEAAVEVEWLEEVMLDFLEVHGLREAVAAVQAAGKRAVVCTPRVLKPDESRMWRFYLGLGADSLLVRSSGMLQKLLELREDPTEAGTLLEGKRFPALRGDFSLNAANEVAVRLLLREGLESLTPAHDLNAAQLCSLATVLGPAASRLEAVVHQHLPIFHTEHCVFCKTLSDGNSYKDCGHPCESNTIHLSDPQGNDHLVLADMGCRNTVVFNARAQSGAFYLQDLRDAGYRSFRIELVDEHGGQVRDRRISRTRVVSRVCRKGLLRESYLAFRIELVDEHGGQVSALMERPLAYQHRRRVCIPTKAMSARDLSRPPT
ncbi:peptidase family U32-domain-containing protein [Baffinella frigidus]|nr:peptidase family U32-domain-containing protein [Cryptophyta sp. CCMP2293]